MTMIVRFLFCQISHIIYVSLFVYISLSWLLFDLVLIVLFYWQDPKWETQYADLAIRVQIGERKFYKNSYAGDYTKE